MDQKARVHQSFEERRDQLDAIVRSFIPKDDVIVEIEYDWEAQTMLYSTDFDYQVQVQCYYPGDTLNYLKVQSPSWFITVHEQPDDWGSRALEVVAVIHFERLIGTWSL